MCDGDEGMPAVGAEAVLRLGAMAHDAVSYAMRTNLQTCSVMGGYGVIMPDRLREVVFEETLRSSLYILSQRTLAIAMADDTDGTMTNPVDLFARGYLMGFELMLCRDARPDDELHSAYAEAREASPDIDMSWLHEIVVTQVAMFADAYMESPGPNAIPDDEFARMASVIESRVGKMYLDSEKDAQSMIAQWWQCLVDGTAKGAIAVDATGIALPPDGQDSLVRRYGGTTIDRQDDLVAQTTVTLHKDCL